MEKLIKNQEMVNKNYEASIRNLERRIGQLSKQSAERPSNTFPSDTIPNPKEECKAIQLRCGRTLENDKADSKEQTEVDKNDKKNFKKEEEPQDSKKGKQVLKEQPQEQRKEKLEINLPLAEALEQMPLYAKFLKELINKKRSWKEKETVILNQECSAVIQEGLPPKLKDPGNFFIPCTIGNMPIDKVLCDLGSSINLMPLSMMIRLSIKEVKPTRMSLQLADRSLIITNGVVENLLVKVGKFIFPADFVILDLYEEGSDLIILGRPFLATARAIIDVEKGEMIFRAHNEQITLIVFKEIQPPAEKKDCMKIEEEDLNWKKKPKELSPGLNNSPLRKKLGPKEKQKH
ncbi:uncharacterized protein LOC130975283 [Arachis stenosperma]|uniref:uncharacterized protein LOC130975283 n=1 Tax=Arachis stenosperma TaxID=217475 RepID=UPI0025ABC5D9|nr:uncharacterized protein LOC130975283 [Arachis stenosperma]